MARTIEIRAEPDDDRYKVSGNNIIVPMNKTQLIENGKVIAEFQEGGEFEFFNVIPMIRKIKPRDINEFSLDPLYEVEDLQEFFNDTEKCEDFNIYTSDVKQILIDNLIDDIPYGHLWSHGLIRFNITGGYLSPIEANSFYARLRVNLLNNMDFGLSLHMVASIVKKELGKHERFVYAIVDIHPTEGIYHPSYEISEWFGENWESKSRLDDENDVAVSPHYSLNARSRSTPTPKRAVAKPKVAATKPATKKVAAKKTVAKKPTTQRVATKPKVAATKPATKKVAAKKTVAKKPTKAASKRK